MTETIAQRVLDELASMLYGDTEPLTTYVGALSSPFQLVEDWASDTDTDEVGWSLLVDVDRCPVEALPWLGQLVGIEVNTSLSEADQRAQIQNEASWRRGTVEAIKSTPVPYLTGLKTVIIRERNTHACPSQPAYGLTVVTYADQTPDSAAVLEALLTQKPAGIILDYSVHTGQDFFQLKSNYNTFADVKAHYSTFADIADDEPPGP